MEFKELNMAKPDLNPFQCIKEELDIKKECIDNQEVKLGEVLNSTQVDSTQNKHLENDLHSSVNVKEEPIGMKINESSTGAINPVFLKCMYDEDTAEKKLTIKEEPLDERDMEIDNLGTTQSQWKQASLEDGVKPKVKDSNFLQTCQTAEISPSDVLNSNLTSEMEVNRVSSNHADSESVIGLDPFCHQSRRVSRGVSTMLVDVLINLVREQRAIYDPSDPVHRDRDAIAALWKDIATKMKCKESDCKAKWDQLRSNFMREKRRITTQPSGSVNIKTKKWVFYNAMEFLIPHVTPHATSNVPHPPDEDTSYDIDDTAPDDNSSTTNITDAPDGEYSQQTAPNVEVCDGESRPTPVINWPSSVKKPNTNKRHCCELPSDVDEHIVGELQKLQEQVVGNIEDECDPDRQFLLSLLPLMKQLLPVDSIDIKIEIHQAFRRKL